jgi:hypothetical protein
MTVLISSLVKYHQLVRDFVRDIITTLYTEMTNEKDKTVTKKRMIRALAKRRHTWQSLFTERPDARLKNMDERSIVRRKRSFHKVFLDGRPRNHLPGESSTWNVKKLRLDDGNGNLITHEDNVENDDGTYHYQEDDKFTRPFYYTENHESEDELEQRFAYYGSQLESEELDNSNSDNNDDQIESQNILLDKDYEKKLSEQLGFII